MPGQQLAEAGAADHCGGSAEGQLARTDRLQQAHRHGQADQADAVPAASWALPQREVNGISEILLDGPGHLLVLERSYSPGHGFGARLYRIGLDAPDTLALASFAQTPPQVAVKQLVADLSTLQPGRLDNMEAMSWGPPLPDGKEFTQYRDAQCSWLASLAGGAAGNATEIRRLSCAAALNFGRAAQLRDATSELPLK